MRRRVVLIAAVLFASLAVSAFAFGQAERQESDWVTVADGERVYVTGTLRLVGTGLFNDYVVTDAQGHDWYIDKAERGAIKGNEQKAIAVEAVVTRESMTLADGKKLEDRRVLTKIKILDQD